MSVMNCDNRINYSDW